MNFIGAIILILIGILLPTGKVDFLIAGYERIPSRVKEKYNIKTFRYVLSTVLVFVGVALLLDYINVLKTIPMYLKYTTLLIVVIIVIKTLISKPKD